MKKSLTVAMLSAVLFATPALAEHHEGGHEGGKRHHGKFFEKVDTDKDGKISKAEHQAKSDEMFTKMDADKDGFVTKEEGKAHWEAKRAEWKAKKAEMGTKKAAE